ncbi:MAG: outer membrane protein transport protein [Planctomycetia bacterium]|nr:outer membrane protein transport protein [Planctomycetia bacterium]
MKYLGHRSLVTLLSVFLVVEVGWSQGIAFRGTGAVNESMGGASTACPIDAAGALYWNPASMTGLNQSQISANFGLILPELSVSSQLPAAFGGYGGGTTDSESGAVPAPTIAIVHRNPDSRWSWGLHLGIIGGAKTNFPASSSITDNPIFCKSQVGYGNVNSDIQVMQLAPSLAYQVTDKLSIGFGPTVTMCYLNCTPLYVVPEADNAVGPGSRWAWGGGFQIGAYYNTFCGWRFGFSYKSENWMEEFRLRTTDSNGMPQVLNLALNYPQIVSLGVCYDGFDKWLFAFDWRYFFFKEAGYGDLGWENAMSFNFGVQRILTDKLSVRGGYSFNQDCIRETAARENLASPLIPGHAVYCGFSYRMYLNMSVHLTYGHIFEKTIEGPYFGETGLAQGISGGYIRSTVSANLLTMGFSVDF